MKALSINTLNYSKILNFLFVLFAFIFPISIAGANILIIFMLIFWILEGNFKEKWEKLKENKLFFILFGIFLSLIISALFSNSFKNAFFMNSHIHNVLFFYLKYFSLYLMFFIIFYTSLQKKFLEKVISAFLLGMLFSEIVSYSIFFNLIDIDFFKKYGLINKYSYPWDPSPFMNHSFYTIFLAVSILLIFDNIFRTKNRLIIFLSVLFLISATVNLFLNGGRLGQLAFILAFVIYSFFKLQKIKYFLLSIIGLIFIIILAYKFSPVFKQRVLIAQNNIEKVIKSQDFETSWGKRIGADIISYKILTNNPKYFLFGLGAGDAKKKYYEFAKHNYFNIYKQIKDLIHVHNQFFQLWIDAGLVVFILIILYFVYLFKMAPIPLTLGIIIVFVIGFLGDVLLYRAKTFLLFEFISVILIYLSTCYETSNTGKDSA